MSLINLIIEASELTGTVMIEDFRGFRHLKVYFDDRGGYVRTGKRGQCKERIVGYNVIDSQLNLISFNIITE